MFDIDGTILSARGVPRIVMNKVLSNRYKNFSYDQNYDFSGRTDPEIIEYLLKFAEVDYSEKDINQILRDFANLLKKEFRYNHQPYLLEGVKVLVNALFSKGGVYLGLVTGNIIDGAMIKLESVGLAQYFPIGAFGDDSKHRVELPPIAQMRAEEYYGIKFSKPNIWIIGDSIYDIRCADMNNLRCLAVASGKTSRNILASVKPEFLEDNLSDTQNILNILLYE